MVLSLTSDELVQVHFDALIEEGQQKQVSRERRGRSVDDQLHALLSISRSRSPVQPLLPSQRLSRQPPENRSASSWGGAAPSATSLSRLFQPQLSA